MAIATRPRYELPVLIGGQEVWGAASLEVPYPYTGEIVGTVPRLTRPDVERALELARDASFELSRHERATILFAIADRLRQEEDAFARLITWESGLCLKDTRYELRRAQDGRARHHGREGQPSSVSPHGAVSFESAE